MASLGNALFSALSHTKAEEAFRPGWDRFEDFLVYGLIILGNVYANQSKIHYHFQ